MPDPRRDDLAAWTIDELAEAYIAALRRRRAGIDPAVGRLQSEWARRPAEERRAALQRFRAGAAGRPSLSGGAADARE